MKIQEKHSHTKGDFRFDCESCKSSLQKDMPIASIEGIHGQPEMRDVVYRVPKDQVDSIVDAINSHEALLEAANIGLRIAEAYAEDHGKMTQAFWDDKDRIVEAIALAEKGGSK